MLVGKEVIDGQQQPDAQQEANRGGHPARHPLRLGVLDCGYEQTPHRSGDHDARCEPQQRLLHELAHGALQEEDERRTQNGSQEGDREGNDHTKVRFAHGVAAFLLPAGDYAEGGLGMEGAAGWLGAAGCVGAFGWLGTSGTVGV